MSLAYQTDDEHDRLEHLPAERYVSEPLPYFTFILIGGIIGVALTQLTTGLERSIASAGFDKPAFWHGGEYWRMLTGATLHGGIAHVVMNCFALYSFGRIFELLTARAHLAIVFLLSAFGGSILSLIFVPEGLSVGASGGIIGLIGYVTVYAFRRRQFVTAEFRKSLLINIAWILVFGLFLYQVIDNYGHVGGLITGAVYGLIEIPTDAYTDPRSASGSVRVIGFACLAFYLASCLFSILVITGTA
jgi:membrane associated rhomboid family serine protease